MARTGVQVNTTRRPRRSDIYSLGGIYFRAIAGPPALGRRYRMQKRDAESAPSPRTAALRSILPHVDADLDRDSWKKCLGKKRPGVAIRERGNSPTISTVISRSIDFRGGPKVASERFFSWTDSKSLSFAAFHRASLSTDARMGHARPAIGPPVVYDCSYSRFLGFYSG